MLPLPERSLSPGHLLSCFNPWSSRSAIEVCMIIISAEAALPPPLIHQDWGGARGIPVFKEPLFDSDADEPL